jgi:hypothetical protein
MWMPKCTHLKAELWNQSGGKFIFWVMEHGFRKQLFFVLDILENAMWIYNKNKSPIGLVAFRVHHPQTSS